MTSVTNLDMTEHQNPYYLLAIVSKNIFKYRFTIHTVTSAIVKFINKAAHSSHPPPIAFHIVV
jgi:hypothetical protein